MWKKEETKQETSIQPHQEPRPRIQKELCDR